YLHFLWNLLLTFAILYLMFRLLRALQKDLTQKVAEQNFYIFHEIRTCQKLYSDHNCASQLSATNAPRCHDWERCLKRSVSIGGRVKLVAELIAEAINSLMDPITWRTLSFVAFSLVLWIFLVNILSTLHNSRHGQPA
ncbi:hypothetical protein K439DRAFT_1378311, partial [Ramaria rubella]